MEVILEDTRTYDLGAQLVHDMHAPTLTLDHICRSIQHKDLNNENLSRNISLIADNVKVIHSSVLGFWNEFEKSSEAEARFKLLSAIKELEECWFTIRTIILSLMRNSSDFLPDRLVNGLKYCNITLRKLFNLRKTLLSNKGSVRTVA